MNRNHNNCATDATRSGDVRRDEAGGAAGDVSALEQPLQRQPPASFVFTAVIGQQQQDG